MKYRVFIEIDVDVEKIEDAEALLDAIHQFAEEFDMNGAPKTVSDRGLQDL